MSAPRLVVLSVSAGAGHVRAAAALCAQAEAQGMTATHLDVMTLVPAWFRWLYADLYATLVNRAPLLWSVLYARMNHPAGSSWLQAWRRRIERAVSARWLARLDALRPDAIVCTHFLPAEVLTYRPAPLACPLCVHVTDFDLHAMWVQPGVDKYFVACEEVGFQLQRAGVDAARIDVTGIALMAEFRPTTRQPAALLALGLQQDRPTVLLMGGGGGFGGLDTVAAQLLEAASDFQLIVMAGRNAKALAALQAMASRWPDRLAALGFTDQVATIMASVDLVITKPGGLTSSECLAMGVAMIVNDPIPGQEERNADHLLEQGAALKAVDAATLAFRLRQLLDHPDQRAAMASRAAILGRPDAARDIIASIASHLKAVH